MTFVGIDVGAQRLHGVALDVDGRVRDGRVFAAVRDVVEWCRGAACIAIDAPDRLSTAPHSQDVDVDGRPLSDKFRRARCAEIGLGTRHGFWVPWATPESDPPGWMAVGLDLFAWLREGGLTAIEVYPHAGFRALSSGARLARKLEPAGITQRTELLRRAGVDERWLSLWSHDSLDAAVAAVIARDHVAGRTVAATCGHDGSAIWLPASL